MTKDGALYYLAYDQVGSLRVVADGSGNPVKQIDYDSFGNVFSDSAPNFAVPFGFAGGLYDKDTKLVRFGYRDYDPDTGRWTAKDPIGFKGGDSDLYGYCVGDPVNLADPYGLVDWGKLATGVLSVSDGATMAGTAVAVTVGTAVLSKSPFLTGVVGAFMIPVLIGGIGDMAHGAHLVYEAIFDDNGNIVGCK